MVLCLHIQKNQFIYQPTLIIIYWIRATCINSTFSMELNSIQDLARGMMHCMYIMWKHESFDIVTRIFNVPWCRRWPAMHNLRCDYDHESVLWHFIFDLLHNSSFLINHRRLFGTTKYFAYNSHISMTFMSWMRLIKDVEVCGEFFVSLLALEAPKYTMEAEEASERSREEVKPDPSINILR